MTEMLDGGQEWPCTDSELVVRLGLTSRDRETVRLLLAAQGVEPESGPLSTYWVEYPTALVVEAELFPPPVEDAVVEDVIADESP